MATTHRGLQGSSRYQHAVRRSRTAERPWHRAEFLGDMVLVFSVLYVSFLLMLMLASTFVV
jgi:hypothetical protein